MSVTMATEIFLQFYNGCSILVYKVQNKQCKQAATQGYATMKTKNITKEGNPYNFLSKI